MILILSISFGFNFRLYTFIIHKCTHMVPFDIVDSHADSFGICYLRQNGEKKLNGNKENLKRP